MDLNLLGGGGIVIYKGNLSFHAWLKKVLAKFAHNLDEWTWKKYSLNFLYDGVYKCQEVKTPLVCSPIK